MRLGLVLVAGMMGQVGPVSLVMAQEQVQPAVTDLYHALQIDEMIAVLRQEGIADATGMAEDFAIGNGSAGWRAGVEAIYDPVRMGAAIDQGLSQAMAGKDADQVAAISFFSNPLGLRVMRLETEARRTLLDKDAEAAAAQAWQKMVSSGDARVALIRQFAEANDLIEANVAGAMNSSLSFYGGMAEAGGAFADMGKGDILDLVRGQEPELRASTTDWLFPYLALAYQPLSDEDLRAYIAFSESRSGQVLNAAMFAAFDDLFNQISADLGRAVGQQLTGQDI